MSYQTILPTEHAPLILLSKTQRGTNATKIWHVVKNSTPSARREEIWVSSCKLNKQGIPPTWSKPKLLTPPTTTVALVQYDSTNSKFEIAFILSSTKITMATDLPQPLEHYISFALNPTHSFSHEQTHVLNLQLRTWMKADQYAQFISMWPNAALQTFVEPEKIFATPFPTSIEQALAAQTLNAQAAVIQAEPPTLVFVPQPITAPLIIPNLHAVNFRMLSAKPDIATCEVILKITPAGRQNSHREVFYATPTAPTLKNPRAISYPISPLKATIALLYADINPASQTFNQPVVKSITIPTSTPGEIAAFLAENSVNMTTTQLEQFNTSQSANQLQPLSLGEPRMSGLQPCLHCGTLFQPLRSVSKFCSEKCRVTHYSLSRRKAQPAPTQNPQQAAGTQQPQGTHQPGNAQPQGFVTIGQFREQAAQVQELSGKVDQILNILISKQ